MGIDMKTPLSAIAIALLLSSCETTQLRDPEVRRKAAAIQILDSSTSPASYKIVSAIEGIDCAATYYSKATPDMALLELKAAAAQKGGNAVANVACENTGWSWEHNCNNSVTCFGDAVILEKAQ